MKMETTRESIIATRAEILARLIYGEPADEADRRAHEQVERVAQAVGSQRRRAIVWLHHILKHAAIVELMLLALGFDSWLVEAADTLGMRHRESPREYAKRVAACNNADVLAVAVAAIDDQIREGIEEQDRLAAYKGARRVLKRALRSQRPGDTPPAGGMADNRPTAPALRSALLGLVEHTDGAHAAMQEMMRGPGDTSCGASERLSLEDLKLFVANLHNLVLVVGVLAIDVTTQEGEDTYDDRRTLFESMTGVLPFDGMATIAQTTARRLQDFIEAPRDEDPGQDKVH